MSRIIRGFFCVGFLILFILDSCILIHNSNPVYAQATVTGPNVTNNAVNGIPFLDPYGGNIIIYPGNEPANITAQVGDYFVNITGYASPNASIAMSDPNGQFLRSTVANDQGYFSITSLTVKKGQSGFCFDTVDFRRLGDSQGCLSFAPITQPRNFNNIYLPPTIGVFKKTINAGEQGLIYGYSMPGANVNLSINTKQTVNITSDAAGYYEYKFPKVPAGKYNLLASGVYNQDKSLAPKKGTTLTALSLTQRATSTIAETGKQTSKLVTTSTFAFLLLLLLLLLIIIGLIILIRRYGHVFIADHPNRGRPLHHDWYLDFIADLNSQG